MQLRIAPLVNADHFAEYARVLEPRIGSAIWDVVSLARGSHNKADICTEIRRAVIKAHDDAIVDGFPVMLNPDSATHPKNAQRIGVLTSLGVENLTINNGAYGGGNTFKFNRQLKASTPCTQIPLALDFEEEEEIDDVALLAIAASIKFDDQTFQLQSFRANVSVLAGHFLRRDGSIFSIKDRYPVFVEGFDGPGGGGGEVEPPRGIDPDLRPVR